MRKKNFPILGLCMLLFASCHSERDPKLDAVKRGIDHARFQLTQAAAEFDSLPGFPRSLMPKFRVIDAYDWTSGFFPGSLWEAYDLTGDETLRDAAEKYTARLD
ncbi:MAG: glucuronyl hydrolase, partial [Alistipes sp.]|nr:glucuronyl hydrolase [Alistipes sp.]